MNLENPIPDVALQEYQPVGFKSLSIWQRVLRTVNWGHRASFRRAWVNPAAIPDGEPVFIASCIDSWHCSVEANLLFNGAKPSMEMLAQFGDLDVEIIDDSSSRARIFRWARAGLKFEIRALAVGKHLYEIIAVSRGEPPRAERLDDHLARARNGLHVPDEIQRQHCLHTVWRFLFGILVTLVVTGIPAILFASVIGAALGLGSLTVLIALATFLISCYFFNLWLNRRQQKYLNEHWFRVFMQGDHDGTVRRALSSIGVDLPVSGTPA